MDNLINVGIADLKVTKAPDRLISYALGSCVGICLYDSINKIAGLLHILLPENPGTDTNLYKYADTAIPILVKKMIDEGALRRTLVAKIAGGANMFQTANKKMTIGERNVEATKRILNNLNIKIIAEETGGCCGRTVEFHSLDGKLYIRSLSSGNKEI